ncbi:MAG: protein BatD [FCB group bacterium]|nr:protein BatD [FCB group bacterium]
MKRLYLYILLLFAVSFSATVKVSVDRDKINEGDSITLTVSVEGGSEAPETEISVLDKDFRIVSGPNQSTSMQWINGQLSSSSSLSWTLLPRRKGSITIPSLNISVAGKKYRSNPINITVYENNASTNLANSRGKIPAAKYFIEAQIDNDNPYRGEQITVTYVLYTSVELTGFDVQDMPSFQGFWKDEIYSPRNLQLHDVRRNGKRYRAATVKKLALFPTRSGEVTIEPMTAVVSVQVRDNNYNWSFFSRSKSYTIASNSIDLKVKPLPISKGAKSASVGNWNVKSRISATDIKQDDAVTLSIRISGTGNLQSVDIDEIRFPAELEVFDPEIKVNQNTKGDKISGSKVIEYVLIPREAGEITIPPVSITYFDVKKEKWVTHKTRSITLKVAPSDRVFTSTQGLTKEEVKMMGKDIRFADRSPVKWRRPGASYFSKTTAALTGTSLFLFLLPGILNYRQNRRSVTARSRVARQALKKALTILPDKPLEPEETYYAIAKAFNHYLDAKTGKKIQRSTSEMLKDLTDAGIPEEKLGPISDILGRGDAVRFAPVSKTGVSEDLNLAGELLREVDNAWK